jgi:DNA-binding transcriptional LysR family regulator
MLDVRSLRYLREVIDCGSFSLAAQRLGRTQQAVSKSIGLLEDQLGVPLLDRGHRRVTATAAGLLALEQVAVIEQGMRRITEAVALLGKPEASRIRIGCGATAAASLLPAVSRQLLEEAPQLQLSIHAGTYNTVLPRLLNDELDLFVGLEVEQRQHPDIIRQRLGYETFVAMARKDHPLFDERTPSLEAASLYPWIVGDNMPQTGSRLMRFLQGSQQPVAVVHTDSISFCLETMLSDDFISLLPGAWLHSAQVDGRLRALRIPQLEQRLPLLLCYRCDHPRRAGFLRVLAALERCAKTAIN